MIKVEASNSTVDGNAGDLVAEVITALYHVTKLIIEDGSISKANAKRMWLDLIEDMFKKFFPSENHKKCESIAEYLKRRSEGE